MRNFLIGVVIAMLGAGLAFVVSSAGLIGLDMEKTGAFTPLAGAVPDNAARFRRRSPSRRGRAG